MGLFGSGGLKNAGQSIAQIIASLVGKDVTVNSLTATSASTPLNATLGPVTANRFLTNLTGSLGVVFGRGSGLGIGLDTGAGHVELVSSSVTQWFINGSTGDWHSTQGRNVTTAGDYIAQAGGGFRLAAMAMRNTAPTVVAGAGASVTASNGSAAFTIDLGGAAQTGTITLPAATTGWVVYMQNVTTPASYVLSQTGGRQTTATFTCYSRTTGLITNWTANDVARCIAIAY